MSWSVSAIGTPAAVAESVDSTLDHLEASYRGNPDPVSQAEANDIAGARSSILAAIAVHANGPHRTMSGISVTASGSRHGTHASISVTVNPVALLLDKPAEPA